MPPSGENPAGGPWGPPADQPPQQSPGQPPYQGPPYPGQQYQGQQYQGQKYGGQPPAQQYPAQQLAYPGHAPYGSVGGYGSGSPAGVQYGPGPRLPIIHPNRLRPGRLGYVIAAIIAVAAIIGGIVGFVINIAEAAGYGDEFRSDDTIRLDSGAQRGIYLTKAHEDSFCHATVSGTSVRLRTYSEDDQTRHKGGNTFYLRYTFKAPQDGFYKIRCEDNRLAGDTGATFTWILGPPSVDQLVSDSGTAFALLFGVGGGGLIIAAGVAALTGSARAKDRRRQQDDIMRTNPRAYNYQGY